MPVPTQTVALVVVTSLVLVLVEPLVSRSSILATEPKVDVEAYQGDPFGIGRMTVHLSKTSPPSDVRPWKLWLVDSEHRVLHPVLLVKMARPIQEGDTGEVGDCITAWFLFRGIAPLNVTLTVRTGSSLEPVPIGKARLVPTESPAVRLRLLDDWWRNYLTRYKEIVRDASWPGQVESYMMSMLAWRLGLESPLDVGAVPEDRAGLIAKRMRESGSFFEADILRQAIQKELLGDRAVAATASQQLLSYAEPALRFPLAPDDTPIETLAGRVPAECFYLRCRSVDNFEWFWTYGFSRASRLVQLLNIRGLDYTALTRLARQLGFEESTSHENPLTNLPVVDLAIIGTDGLINEGAAIGVLFQTRESGGLQASLNWRRHEASLRTGATDQTVEIEGHRVSLFSNPDQSVRSFYAVDGEFHLLTNSQTLVKRFYQTTAGTNSLARLDEFRSARHIMPLARNDTLFAYLSEHFLRNLDSSHYRIEMLRRLRADAEIEIVHCARLAAFAEKSSGETIEQLKAGGFLPKQFGVRLDGSHAVVAGGKVFDSLRGGRRSFVPVPDLSISTVSQEEVEGYAAYLRLRSTSRLAYIPVIVGVGRNPTVHGRGERKHQTDHITVEVMLPGDGIRSDLPTALMDVAKLPAVEQDAASSDTTRQIDLGNFRDEFNPRDFPASYVVRDGWWPPGELFDRNEELALRRVVPADMRPLFTGWPLGSDSRQVLLLRSAVEWCSRTDPTELPAAVRALLRAMSPNLQLTGEKESPQLRIMRTKAVMPAMFSHIGAGLRRCRNGDVRFVTQIHYQLQVPVDQAMAWSEVILGRRVHGGGMGTAVLKSGEKILTPPNLDLGYKAQYASRGFYDVSDWQIEMSVNREQRLFTTRATFDISDWEH